MTIRTFWTIFLKILGIYLVVDSLTIIPQFLSGFAFAFIRGDHEDNLIGLLLTVSLVILTIVIYFFILKLFVYKTAWLIDKLHLDKGFTEEKFEITMHRSIILKLAIIVIGGLMFIDALPLFCNQIFTYFQQTNNSGLFGSNHTSAYVILYFIKGIIGYLMMTNSSYITNYIEHKRLNK